METEFKALMYCGQYVDANLLYKGIYTCEKPFIYDKNYTIETMIDKGESMKDLTGANFLSQGFFDNLRQCELVTITITIK